MLSKWHKLLISDNFTIEKCLPHLKQHFISYWKWLLHIQPSTIRAWLGKPILQRPPIHVGNAALVTRQTIIVELNLTLRTPPHLNSVGTHAERILLVTLRPLQKFEFYYVLRNTDRHVRLPKRYYVAVFQLKWLHHLHKRASAVAQIHQSVALGFC